MTTDKLDLNMKKSENSLFHLPEKEWVLLLILMEKKLLLVKGASEMVLKSCNKWHNK